MERPVIVLDTSALVFWTLDPARLSGPAIRAIDSADGLLVSSISVWEVGLKAKQGKLSLPLSTAAYVSRLQSLAGLTIEPVDTRTWLTNLELEWDHRDPADRTIVATAMIHSCPLVTSDRLIRAFYDAAVW